MKRILFTFIVLFLFTTTAHSAIKGLPPELGLYVGGKLGYTHEFVNDAHIRNIKFSDDTPSMGFGIAGGVIYPVLPKMFVRGELEYMIRIPAKYDADHWASNARAETFLQTILLNAYLDYFIMPKIAVFGTFGMGMAITGAKGYNTGTGNLGYDPNFAWQIGAGATYAVNNSWLLDFTFRYVDALEFKSSEATIPLSSLELLVGVRFAF